MTPMDDSADAALLALSAHLRADGYAFVTPTPATHARVLVRRPGAVARTTADVLGWSLPFAAGTIDPVVERRLTEADMLDRAAGAVRSRIRVSRLRDRLYIHAAFPTTARDAVFFGPDSYRFAELIAGELAARPAPADARILDIGTGSGVGAIVAATIAGVGRAQATDINPAALRLARINAAAAGIALDAHGGADLRAATGAFDLIVSNPPFLVDAGRRAYRDGGDLHGGRVSLDIAAMAVARLAPGGRLILYTASAIVAGRDALAAALAGIAVVGGGTLHYRELDPDIFGEELDAPAYADVDRIALVAAIVTRPG